MQSLNSTEIIFDLPTWKNPADQYYQYIIAGQVIQSTHPFKELKPFTQGQELIAPCNKFGKQFNYYSKNISGWIGNATRNIIISGDLKKLDINIESLASFTLIDLHTIQLNWSAPNLPNNLLLELILGPPLAIILASRNIWLLHAGSVTNSAHTIVFSGQSGVGKSTLCNRTYQTHNFNLLSDDVVPIYEDTGIVYASSSFPKLKTTTDKFVISEKNALYLFLELQTDIDNSGFTTSEYSSMEKIFFFIRNSVSVRAMPSEYHQKQLLFINTIVGQCKCLRALYSHNQDGFNQFDRWIERYKTTNQSTLL